MEAKTKEAQAKEAYQQKNFGEASSLFVQLADATEGNQEGARHLRNAAKCCLAGIWLRFGYLDESHTISQDIHTIEGSYWHGIMHRHEPDYGNAKYWFRQVGQHPIYSQLGDQASTIATNINCPASVQWPSEWDPMRFIDFCQQEEHSGPNQELAVALVELEWKLLFEYCLRRAQPNA